MNYEKMSVGWTPEPRSEIVLTSADMNPDRLKLQTGQIFETVIDDEETKFKKKRMVQILKLYRHHAFCRVGGHKECFSYNELSTMTAIRSKVGM